LIHGGSGVNCVRNFFAGDEASGGALADAGAFGDPAQRPALGESNEEGS
jgi:hypothetical protein